MLARMQLWGAVGAGAALAAGAATAASAEPAIESSGSFVVTAPNAELARTIARRAERLSGEIAQRWFGEPLPPPARKACIHVTTDARKTSAATSLHADRQSHITWMTGSVDDCTGYLLAHEVAHTVLGRRFGAEMPAWANEGVACQYDDHESRRIRADVLRAFVARGAWPNLAEVMTEPVRSKRQYAAAVSLTEYLLALDSRPGAPRRLFEFVEDGAQQGWAPALRAHYGIQDMRQLQRRWQAWVHDAVTAPGARLATLSGGGVPAANY